MTSLLENVTMTVHLFRFICKFGDKYSGLKMEKSRLPSIKYSYLPLW